jgi:nucleotide-binding universal stress UspA family protein
MSYLAAVHDFRRARLHAIRARLVARLTGKSTDLLAYDQVREMLKARASQALGLQDIPLDAIVGSVGRYADFSRTFLPLQDDDQERWARVYAKITDLTGLPPIDVYQIGQAYFVCDGNHRVSAARQMGVTHIQAYVTEIETEVPLTPDVQPDDLILKAELAEFLEDTRLKKIRPAAELSVTLPSQYPVLRDQIEVHRYLLGVQQQRDVPLAEAAVYWYDQVYTPVIRTIRKLNVLHEFTGRTETDLYVWASEHRTALEESLGWEIDPEDAVVDLAEQFSPMARHRVARIAGRLLDALGPGVLAGGPAPGTWRQERLAIHHDNCLFAHVLVPVSGGASGWPAVAQAVEIACRESARLLGLHVVRSAAEKDSEQVRAVQAEFARQCELLGVAGTLAVEVGRIARKICQRSRWADLVVLSLAHPPQAQPISRQGSGFQTLIRHCSAPVLAVPGTFSSLSRPLLGYDGSPKAREALFVATYIAARGQVPLVVVSVIDGERVTPAVLDEAQEYLERRGVTATYVQGSGPAAEAILEAAASHDSDLILMGGYGHNPVVKAVLGSAVDQVLRASRQPVLICR